MRLEINTENLTKLYGNHLIDLSLLPEIPVVIDAGACVGNVVKDLYKHRKKIHVFTIEPYQKNIDKLLESCLVYDVIKAALVSTKEETHVPFYVFKNKNEWGNVTGVENRKTKDIISVQTVNINDLLEQIPFKTIDYLKMDIEGSEYGVIEDMNEENTKEIKQISMEVHSGLPKSICDKLEKIGYSVLYEKGEIYAVRKEL